MVSRRDSEQWPLKDGRISTFRALEGGMTVPRWQHAIRELGVAAWEGTGASGKRAVALEALLARLCKSNPDLGLEIENLAFTLVLDGIEFSTILGYSLAKTYPAGLEGMDNWVELALNFGELHGFARKADSEEDELHEDLESDEATAG